MHEGVDPARDDRSGHFVKRPLGGFDFGLDILLPFAGVRLEPHRDVAKVALEAAEMPGIERVEGRPDGIEKPALPPVGQPFVYDVIAPPAPPLRADAIA